MGVEQVATGDAVAKEAAASVERLLAARRKEVRQLEIVLAQITGMAVVNPPDLSTPLDGAYVGMGIIQAAELELKIAGGPLGSRELVDRMMQKGWTTRSKNRTATLYATLVNAPNRFKRTETGEWDLVDRQPAATEAHV